MHRWNLGGLGGGLVRWLCHVRSGSGGGRGRCCDSRGGGRRTLDAIALVLVSLLLWCGYVIEGCTVLWIE